MSLLHQMTRLRDVSIDQKTNWKADQHKTSQLMITRGDLRHCKYLLLRQELRPTRNLGQKPFQRVYLSCTTISFLFHDAKVMATYSFSNIVSATS